MSLYEASVPQFSKMLKNLLGCLDKAVAHAEAKKFDPEILLTARLAPDQFPLIRQIQTACDAAKFGAARLAGKEAPSHPDTEKTLPEIRARITTVLDYLAGFKPEDFAGAAERRVFAPVMFKEKYILGADYLNQFALPNFYFHVTVAYEILRHNGVDVGKRDYLGDLPLRDP